MNLISIIKNLISLIKTIEKNQQRIYDLIESNKILTSRLIRLNAFSNSSLILENLVLSEFTVFSQWGDDGVIDFLIKQISIENKYFIEFGVENYQESNTRFLLMSSNWSGLIIDSSQSNIDYIKKSELYWKHNLNAVCEFITAENIDSLLLKYSPVKIPGIISIDIDGIDYWVWKNIISLEPIIIIIEYNSIFGNERALSVPYNSKFDRKKMHYSHLYFGASIKAFYDLGVEKGYSLIYCTSSGNNAYFVKSTHLGNLKSKSYKEAYVKSKFRESRDEFGNLSYLSHSECYNVIKGLPIHDLDLKDVTFL
jgi:hypothetical protein